MTNTIVIPDAECDARGLSGIKGGRRGRHWDLRGVLVGRRTNAF